MVTEPVKADVGPVMSLSKNLCLMDRIVRGVIAIIAIGAGVLFGDVIGDVVLQVIVVIFGVLNLISFVFGWCPVYSMANISTCKDPIEE